MDTLGFFDFLTFFFLLLLWLLEPFFFFGGRDGDRAGAGFHGSREWGKRRELRDEFGRGANGARFFFFLRFVLVAVVVLVVLVDAPFLNRGADDAG